MKKITVFFVAALLVGACKEDNSITPWAGAKIFTLAVDQDPGINKYVNWLLVHDTDGHLIFYKSFVAGDTVKATSAAKIESGKVNVTILKYTSFYWRTTYNLTSYLQVPLGEVWNLKNQQSNSFGQGTAGAFSVTASNFPIPTQFSLSDMHGNSSGFGLSPEGNGSYIIPGIRDTATPDFILTSRDKQDNLGYKFLNQVTVNTQYAVSLADMTTPETIITPTFPQSDAVILRVSGYEDNQSTADYGYRLHDNYESETLRTQIAIGYPDRFHTFRTYLGLQNSNGLYQYEKIGTKSSGISLSTDPVFTLANRSFPNFSFTTSSTFARRHSVWQYANWWNGQQPEEQVDISWTVESPAVGEQKIGELPPQFSTIYPELKFAQLVHTETTFFLSGGTSYDDLVSSSFKGKTLPADYEAYSVNKQ